MKPTYIIAEAGVNHNGSLAMAIELVDAASEAGANAVKFQTFKASNIVTQSAPKAGYQELNTDAVESQYEMLKKLELSADDHQTLINHCKQKKIDFLSTPFDLESIDLLVQTLGLTVLKLPSGEITNAPLILKAAQSGASIILSTGMSTIGEVETALGVLAFGFMYPAGTRQPSLLAFQESYASDEGQKLLQEKVTILHCTTEYPAPYEDVNLRVIDTLQQTFQLPIGYSDHTEGIAVAVAAVARGAAVVEKHFTLDRSLPGPDHQASLEPNELIQMVKSIRQVELAVGHPRKSPVASELPNRLVARKSIVAAKDIAEGELFTEQNLTVKRPGDGVSPIHLWDYIGKAATQNYSLDDKVKL